MMSVSDIPHKIFDTSIDAICKELDHEERKFSEVNANGLSCDQCPVHRFLNHPNSRRLISDEIGCHFRNHLNCLRRPYCCHPRRKGGPNHPIIRNHYYCHRATAAAAVRAVRQQPSRGTPILRPNSNKTAQEVYNHFGNNCNKLDRIPCCLLFVNTSIASEVTMELNRSSPTSPLSISNLLPNSPPLIIPGTDQIQPTFLLPSTTPNVTPSPPKPVKAMAMSCPHSNNNSDHAAKQGSENESSSIATHEDIYQFTQLSNKQDDWSMESLSGILINTEDHKEHHH